MGRVFTMGDIHGAHLALQQVLERSGFDKENDTLIQLGDVADGWKYVKECVDILLSIKNRIDIIGNHDEWFKAWMNTGRHPQNWLAGGEGTAKSYLRTIDQEDLIERDRVNNGYVTALNPGDISAAHWKFFMYQNLYYYDNKRNYFFCHAGWDRETLVERVREICPDEFYWDRKLWKKAMCAGPNTKLRTADDFDCIFIGHTATTNWSARNKATEHGVIVPEGGKIDWPLYMGGIWNLDTGAGWSGRLTIMDIDTKQYWQSDQVEELYPDESVRRKWK